MNKINVINNSFYLLISCYQYTCACCIISASRALSSSSRITIFSYQTRRGMFHYCTRITPIKSYMKCLAFPFIVWVVWNKVNIAWAPTYLPANITPSSDINTKRLHVCLVHLLFIQNQQWCKSCVCVCVCACSYQSFK